EIESRANVASLFEIRGEVRISIQAQQTNCADHGEYSQSGNNEAVALGKKCAHAGCEIVRPTGGPRRAGPLQEPGIYGVGGRERHRGANRASDPQVAHGCGWNEQQADESEKHACAAPERRRYSLLDRIPYRAASFNLALSAN